MDLINGMKQLFTWVLQGQAAAAEERRWRQQAAPRTACAQACSAPPQRRRSMQHREHSAAELPGGLTGSDPINAQLLLELVPPLQRCGARARGVGAQLASGFAWIVTRFTRSSCLGRSFEGSTGTFSILSRVSSPSMTWPKMVYLWGRCACGMCDLSA